MFLGIIALLGGELEKEELFPESGQVEVELSMFVLLDRANNVTVKVE